MDAVAWTIITGMFGGIVLLMVLLYRHLKGQLDSVSSGFKDFSEAIHEFDSFRAMDREREKHWMEWRNGFERQMDDHIKSTAAWRHNELSPTLKRIEETVTTIKETVRHLELQGEQRRKS